MMDSKAVSDLLNSLSAFVRRSLEPLHKRLRALEDRPPPERGEPGPAGEKGDRGDPGPSAEVDHVRVAALLLEDVRARDVLRGPTGDAGPRGEKGEPGADGRDALAVEVLDVLDVRRSYPRGTFASFRGGLVRSFRATDPLELLGDEPIERSGWAVIVNGVAELQLDVAEDGRSVTLRTAHTDGKARAVSVALPTMVYRGVWREGEYAVGDTVTWDGSLWVARTATTAKPQGAADSGWQLAAKRGRDGRDGARGERGEKGADGRAGRDLTQMTPDGTRF